MRNVNKMLSRSLLSVSFAAAIMLSPVGAFAQEDAGAIAGSTTTVDTTPASAPPPAVILLPAELVPPVSAIEAVPLTALDNLSSEVINILVPAFGTLIAGLISLILLWLRRRFKLQVSDQQIYSWSNLARKGALRGAEWARKKVKGLTEGKKIPGPEILEVGVNWALEVGKAAGLPEMGRKELEGWIEAELFDLRREEVAPLKLDYKDPYVHSARPHI